MDFKTTSDLDILDPEPGIYINVPDATYFKIEAVNSSKLSTILRKTPSKVKYNTENPENNVTDSKILGSTAHVCLLQPEQLEDRVKLLPEGYAGSKKWKQELVERFDRADLSVDNNKAENMQLIMEEYQDEVVTTKEILEQAKAMVNRLKWEDAEFYDFKLWTILDKGHAEVVFIWVDEKTGLKCKAKFDHMNFDIGLGMDYKTTGKEAGASPRKFMWSVSDYGYHIQLIHYFKGARACDTDLLRNAILAQETEPPYPHAWYEFVYDQDPFYGAKGTEFQVAEYQWELAMKKYAYCVENDIWPGYSRGLNSENVFPIKLKFDDYRMYQEDPFTNPDEHDLPFDSKDPIEKLDEIREDTETLNTIDEEE